MTRLTRGADTTIHLRTHLRPGLLLLAAGLGFLAACGGPELDADEGEAPEFETAETGATALPRYRPYSLANFDVFWSCVGGPEHCPAGSGHTITAAAQGTNAACSNALRDANAQGATLSPRLSVVSRGPAVLSSLYLPPNGSGANRTYAYCPVTVTRHVSGGPTIVDTIRSLSPQLTCPAETTVDYYPRGCKCDGPIAGDKRTCPAETPVCARVPAGTTASFTGMVYTRLPHGSTTQACINWCDARPSTTNNTCMFGPTFAGANAQAIVIKTY